MRVRAVRVENKVQGREGKMVVCGVAAVVNLDAAVAVALHALLRCTDESRGGSEGVGRCGASRGVRGWFYSAGPAYRGRGARTKSMAHGGDISSRIRRDGARDVATRRPPGSGHVLEALARVVRDFPSGRVPGERQNSPDLRLTMTAATELSVEYDVSY